MSLALFSSVPAGAIETLFDDQHQPWFKRADLGRYLGIVKVKNSMHIPSHFMCKRQDIERDCCTTSLRKRRNPHDAFIQYIVQYTLQLTQRKKKLQL